MPNSVVIVSAGDSKYAGLVLELIASIKAHKESAQVDIAIMDVGMTAEQSKAVEATGATLFRTEWPCDIPAHRLRGREYIKACVCRPFLNKYLPDYETIVWLDTDTWVQDWSAIDLYIKAAQKKVLACTLQVDRAYPYGSRTKWLGPILWKARGFYFSNAKKAFSHKVAQTLFKYPTIQAGAFAIHKDAPHWDKWQELILKALKKGNPFTAEQLTMGMMIHMEGYPAEFLPAWCNWIHTKRLLWDTKKALFVEPYMPNHVIGVMHLTGLDDMRVDASVTVPMKTTDGGEIPLCLRYGHQDVKAKAA